MGLPVYPDNNTLIRIVGNGGRSGIIYLPKKYTGFGVKIIIPGLNGGIEEIIQKKVGRHKFSGVIYVHKKHLGTAVKIVLPEQISSEEVDVSAR